jgi:hypothetical protein
MAGTRDPNSLNHIFLGGVLAYPRLDRPLLHTMYVSKTLDGLQAARHSPG